MKICIFVGFYPLIKGGAEYQMRLIAEELIKDNEIFYISMGHAENSVFYENNIKVYTLSLEPYYYNKAFMYYPVFSRIRRILNIEKPDLIYQRILNSFSFHLASYASNKCIPFYIHIADCYSLVFEKKATGVIRRYMFKSIIRSSVKFIVQTDEQRKLLSYWGINPILKIYNLHPLPIRDVSLLRAYNKQKNILWIGSTRKVKRLDLFLDLAEKYRNNDGWKFIVVGRLEPGTYSDTLSARIALLDNVTYLGERDNGYINNLLEIQADLLVNTSDSEGFSNTFIQAWLRGIPVLSLNSNPDNILTNYDLGIYCHGKLEELFMGLELLLNNMEYFDKLRKNALTYAPQLFSIKGNISEIRKILIQC